MIDISLEFGEMNLTSQPSTAHNDPSESDAIAVMLSGAIEKEGPFLESFRD